MAFAPYANNTRTIGHDPVILGQFREFDTDNTFEFADRHSAPADDFCAYEWAPMSEFPHVIHTIDGRRYARVLKTVAYIVVDEDEFGRPVTERWNLRGYRAYEVAS